MLFSADLTKADYAVTIVAPISLVVTTAANGKPFPIPLAMVTISGITPCPSNPQKCSPVRPNPVSVVLKFSLQVIV